MASIEEQVKNCDSVICENIQHANGDRGLLAQNLLSQLRNLVEGLILWAHAGDASTEFNYNKLSAAVLDAKAKARFRLLARFHDLLQSSASHYTLDKDSSERLMLKYYEYLIRTRKLVHDELGIAILNNLEQFPIDLDPSLREYHEKIAERIAVARATPSEPRRDRYYIHSSRPFFAKGNIYYEVTFSVAHNTSSKFDRTIAFTDVDITDRYAAYLDLATDSIEVLGRNMPILIIRDWEVSIRPCEFENFARIFGAAPRIESRNLEYRNLMGYLTRTRLSLLDLMDMGDADYARLRADMTGDSGRKPVLFPILDEARQHVRAGRAGSRVLRYLMLRMRNQIIKGQLDSEPNPWLSGLRLTSRSAPFDRMPFCTSPAGHVPGFADLAASIDPTGRKHELLARRVKNLVEQHGTIYTPAAEFEDLGDVDELIAAHNGRLPSIPRHAPRKLKHENGHVFIVGYEDAAVAIIEKLQEATGEGVERHSDDVNKWLHTNPEIINDPAKAEALTALFDESNVAIITGAAGTGKSTMVNHIANYFSAESKLFLAHTNTAVENLKRRVDAPNTQFSTIASHIYNSGVQESSVDVLVIDECSAIDNESILKVLQQTSFDLLVLVGDVYQIEAIQFGNWFSLARSYIPKNSTFELTKPYRTDDDALLTLWSRVRGLDDRIEESLSKNGYSMALGEDLFTRHSDDEIVLCLNYDGLYGINNVNRFLQASNPEKAVTWGESTYKVGDPVLFNETNRFKRVISNTTKGTIASIERVPGRITFDVDLKRDVSEAEVYGIDLRKVDDTIVQFDVFERGNSDEDDDVVETLVPFQVAYAVSIHKAQGLEYDSVKVVITDANEERISHSIFYTAITRARRQLRVFWTPETQQRILSRLTVSENTKDEN
ncbi:AAA family ATPase, partial [Gordonia polyisoprenivorans]|nr:AAA family ATPase [Gordonia polyisoprenivorans]